MEGLLSFFSITGTAWAHGGEEHGGAVQAVQPLPPGDGGLFSNIMAQVGTADAVLFFLFILGAAILYERQAKLMDLTSQMLGELRTMKASEGATSRAFEPTSGD